jgi:ferritin-like protein
MALLLLLSGCSMTSLSKVSYDAEGNVTQNVKAERFSFLQFARIDGVDFTVDPETRLIVGPVLVDPESGQIITPWGVLKGGE